MIYIIATYKAKPGLRDEFVSELKKAEITKRANMNPGNVCFDYRWPVEDDGNTVYLVEIFKDKASMDVHQKSDYVPVILALKDKYVETTDIKRVETED